MSKEIKEAIKYASDNKIRDIAVASKKEAFQYAMPVLERFYNEVCPNMTTVNTGNVVYFNSTEEVEDNAYLAQLINTYQQKSTTFANLINLTRNMLIGNGLEPVQQGDAGVLEFLNKPNQYGESLQEQWQKYCFDYALFQAYTIEALYSQDGKVSETVHIDTSTVRAKANENPNVPWVTTFFLSRAWAKISNKNYRRYTVATSGVPINIWNPLRWAEDGGRQLMYVKRYTAGNEVYSIPSWQPVLQYCELDYQLACYHNNKVSKGFFPNVIVNLCGNPDETEKAAFTNKFKQKYIGSDKEKILFTWSTDENTKPTIVPFNTSDNSDVFEILNRIVIEKISSGMGTNAELAGIQFAGGASLGGDANKLAVSYNLFYANVVKPMQQEMLKGINKIMKHNELGLVTVVTPALRLETTNAVQAPTPEKSNNPNINPIQ